MFKKWDKFVAQKAEAWPEEKFFFVFIKLPVILLSAYAALATGAALWSFNKNMQTAQDFLKMEESCDRLQQSCRARDLYRAQYQRQLSRREQYGRTGAMTPLP